eukprot:15344437-Ditylum_brightwellii.AAC.1
MLNIQQHQFKDLHLNSTRRQNSHRFPVKEIEGRSLIYYRDEINDPVAPSLSKQCKEYQCGDCQRNKAFGTGFGELPAWHAALTLWSKNAIDLIEPWRIKIRGEDVDFNALTCIDIVSNLVEMIRVENKTAEHVAQ